LVKTAKNSQPEIAIDLAFNYHEISQNNLLEAFVGLIAKVKHLYILNTTKQQSAALVSVRVGHHA